MTSLKHDAPGGFNLDSARGKNGCAQLEACRLPALQAIGLSKFGDLHRPERHNPSLNHYFKYNLVCYGSNGLAWFSFHETLDKIEYENIGKE